MRPEPIPPRPGQESVWDYPRPPRLEPVRSPVRVELAGHVVAESTSTYRVLETSHPPTFYVPPQDCALELLEPSPGRSVCEWKGAARYETVRVDGVVADRAAWHYPDPTESFAEIADHRSFYPALLDCTVDGRVVRPQAGGFYGGWVTPDLVGPFKGEEGSTGW